jgi:hypothetical protein
MNSADAQSDYIPTPPTGPSGPSCTGYADPLLVSPGSGRGQLAVILGRCPAPRRAIAYRDFAGAAATRGEPALDLAQTFDGRGPRACRAPERLDQNPENSRSPGRIRYTCKKLAL